MKRDFQAIRVLSDPGVGNPKRRRALSIYSLPPDLYQDLGHLLPGRQEGRAGRDPEAGGPQQAIE